MRRLKSINWCTVYITLIRQDVCSREVNFWNRAWEPFFTTRNSVVTHDPIDERTTNPNLPPHLDVNLSYFIKTVQQPCLCFQRLRLKYLLKTFLEGLPGWGMEGTDNYLKTHQRDKRNLAKHSILIRRKEARENISRRCCEPTQQYNLSLCTGLVNICLWILPRLS